MADVSNLHHQPPSTRGPVVATTGPLQEEPGRREEEFYHQPNPSVFDFELSLHPNNYSISSFLDDYATSFDFGFDFNPEDDGPGSEYEEPNCFFVASEEDDEQMNFVTDLFETRQTSFAEDAIWEPDSRGEASPPEFGFGPGLGSGMGLRVVDMDSESDSEEFEVNSGFTSSDNDSYDRYGVGNNNHRGRVNEREEFEWEEVSERIQFDERENLNSAINRIEEISVSSDMSSSEEEDSTLTDDGVAEEEQNVEWEVLLAVNNLGRALELENENNVNEVPRINLTEDYIFTMENDGLFGRLMEHENALKGSPPASKSVVENLPSVVLTKDEVGKNNTALVCAVCKDEFAVGEKVVRMPCCHLYHGDCILPWLSIRNTCPVCRYELPTDDAGYEKRRGGRGAGGITAYLANDFEARER